MDDRHSDESGYLDFAIDVSRRIRDEGGRALAVGGYVRDRILQVPRKDVELEVFGIEPDRLIKILSSLGKVDLVGRAFGVLKVGGLDVSLPRREKKTGAGHRGFHVDSDPHMPYEEASRRRDLTVNSMAEDLLTGEILDPHGGRKDLKNRMLRAVDHDHFSEDPLRVLRICRFAARFLFHVDRDTAELCRSLDLSELPGERIFEEFRLMLLGCRFPSVGLQTMRNVGALRFFPELESLIDCKQEYEWHPEGDVWVHTLLVVDAAAGLKTGDPYEDLVLMLAAVCHDLGKPPTTRFDRGRIRSMNHEKAGEKPAREFLARSTREKNLVEDVVGLVVHHLRPHMFHKSKAGPAAIRRLSTKVPIGRLVRLARADHYGRTTPDALDRVFLAGEWLLEKAKELEVAERAPTPILMGRHLLERDVKPGPHMGKVLARAFEAQLDGDFSDLDGALAWLDRVGV